MGAVAVRADGACAPTVDDLVKYFDALVARPHEVALHALLDAGHVGVERHHDQHHRQPGQHGGADLLPEHEHRDDNLQRRRPDVVEVRQQVVEAARVHSHEVHHLAHRVALLRAQAEAQALAVDGCDDADTRVHPDAKDAVKVLVEAD